MPGSIIERLDSLGIKKKDIVVCYSDYNSIEEMSTDHYSLIFNNEFIMVWERIFV